MKVIAPETLQLYHISLFAIPFPFCVWFVPPFVPYFDCDGRTAPRKCMRPMSPMQSEVGRRVADTAQRGSLDVNGLLMCVFIIVLYDSDIDANGTHCAVCTLSVHLMVHLFKCAKHVQT